MTRRARPAVAWLRARLAVAPLGALCVAACGDGDHDAYFPLASGHEWTYQVTWQRGDPVQTLQERLTLRTRGADTIGGGRAWRRRSDTGTDYWLRADDSGVFRVASKTDLQPDPQPDEPRRYVLRQPYAVGTQWVVTTTPYVLQRRHEFPQTQYQRHTRLDMHYRIAAVGERITTAAGAHADCLRVEGQATLRVFFDAQGAWRDSPVTHREWYCRGIGLVRLERHEPSASKLLDGGAVTLELLAWR
jgi:hypothetical protein